MPLRFQRLLDLAGGLVLGASTLVLLPVIAAAIWREDRGPIFYRQVRLGHQGRPFVIWKFRSMEVESEAAGAQWACQGDPRITRIGRWLRQTHLDELPQAWNLLRGDMTLVGPRPERPEIARELATRIPGFEQRLAVKPGITGLAQVSQPYVDSVEGSSRKLACDLDYIARQSLWLDLQILSVTLWSMLRRHGR